MTAGYVKYRKVQCHTVSNFRFCHVPFIRKSTVSTKISPTKDSAAGTRRSDKAFAYASGGKWIILLATKTFGLYALLLKNPAKHDFATKLA